MKLVSPQRSKSIFSNKNRFATPTEFSLPSFLQIKLACLRQSHLNKELLWTFSNKRFLTLAKSVFGWNGLGGSLHGQQTFMESWNWAGLFYVQLKKPKKPQIPRSFLATQCWQCKETPIYFSNTQPPIKQQCNFCCLWESQQNQKACLFHNTNQ